MKHLTTTSKVKAAIDMVIMDAIEKGHTDKDQLIAYMKTEEFEAYVNGYIELFNAHEIED